MTKRILMTETGRSFFVADTTNDYHSQYGFVKAENFKNKSGVVETNTGKKLNMFEPSFIDLFKKIKRGAQIVPLKEIGTIITETGIDKNSVVVDSGSGSGAVACFLGHLVKKVHTFDIRDDFIKIVEHNIKKLGLKNVVIKKQNVYENIPIKNVDLVFLDLPEPWEAINSVSKSLKPGGFFCLTVQVCLK